MVPVFDIRCLLDITMEFSTSGVMMSVAIARHMGELVASTARDLQSAYIEYRHGVQLGQGAR